jgi:hypothetical protein
MSFLIIHTSIVNRGLLAKTTPLSKHQWQTHPIHRAVEKILAHLPDQKVSSTRILH